MLNVIFFLILRYLDIREDGNATKGKTIECKEDGMVDEFLKLVLVETVFRLAFYIFWWLYWRCKSCCIEDFDWRQEFDLGDEFVWTITYNLIFWCGSLVYPVLAPI